MKSSSSSIGGPPVALVYQHARGATLRGTLASYFVIGAVMSIAALAAAGLFGRADLLLSLALVPGTVIGFAASRWTVGWVDRRATRPLVLILSLIYRSPALTAGNSCRVMLRLY